ncbi:hypothetical protein ACFE04_018366 [Oxalis oulophora]
MAGGSISFFATTLMIEEEEEDVMVNNKKQGIVSILECDNNNINNNKKKKVIKKGSSLRRTLSADMSSKKWLTQSGLINSPMKKISSSLELLPLSITDAEDETETETETDDSSPTQFDIWSSIVSKKEEEDNSGNTNISTAYIHPLVRRSTSALSDKSLEICTESLGSETGSDGFSFATGDGQVDKKDEKVVVNVMIPQQQQQQQQQQQLKCFPPPLPSLSRGDGAVLGAPLRITSHRDNGRLVLQAVPISQQNNNFKAQREGGRLVLTFSSENNTKESEFEEEFESEMGEDEEEQDYSVFEQAPKTLSGRLINVHRLALMVNKPMGLTNMNQTWSNKFNEMAQSLPPRQTGLIPSSLASATSFNAYEYYWRPKPMEEQYSKNNNGDNQKLVVSRSCKDEGLVILKGKSGDFLAKGFKEPRRSLLMSWEPCCVATT